jgi:hypothetical protein
VQPLFPESMRDLSTKEFMDTLPQLDAQYVEYDDSVGKKGSQL